MDILLAGLAAIVKGFMGLNEGKTLPYLILIVLGFLVVGLFLWFMAVGMGMLN